MEAFLRGEVAGNYCHFSAAAGKEMLASFYLVLTATSGQYSLEWEASSAPPKGALVAGKWGEVLYLCQLSYQGGLHVGWAIPAQDGRYVCYIGYGGSDVVLPANAYLLPMNGQPID